MTRLGRTWLAVVKFRLEALGRGEPAGQTVTNPPAPGSTPVTLRTTAVTPVGGTPAWPSTARVIVWPGWMYPPPVLVSNNRRGAGRGTKADVVAAGARAATLSSASWVPSG